MACHAVMWTSVTDLATRQGMPLGGTAEEWWHGSQPLHRLLADLGRANLRQSTLGDGFTLVVA